MLNVAFDDLLSKPAAKNPPAKKKPAVGKLLSLGDPLRIKNLPESVNEEFLDAYQDSLDTYLHAYITGRQLTLSEAARYKEYIFSTIFGNQEHLGLFDFFRAKAESVYGTEKEMVTAAETFMMRGWQIRKEEERWWIVNDSFDKVLDVTGSTEVSEDAASAVFTQENAHVFLSDSVASKVSALAKKAGFDADSLASMGQLDLLLAETDNKEFAGYLMNYNAMRFLLKKSGKYSVLSSGKTFQELYEEGFRLGNQIFYPTLSRVILEKGSDKILLSPVSSELHPEHLVNKSLLSCVASDIRTQLYGRNVVAQNVVEIGEMGYAVALQTDFWTTDVVRNTPADTYDLLMRTDNAARGRSLSVGHYKNLRSAFAEMLLGEIFLLGNTKFSLSSFGFDSVGGKFFIYAGEELFSRKDEAGLWETLGRDSYEFFSICMRNRFALGFIEKNLETLVSYTSEQFRNNVLSAEVDSSRYPLNLDTVKTFFAAAKKAI